MLQSSLLLSVLKSCLRAKEALFFRHTKYMYGLNVKKYKNKVPFLHFFNKNYYFCSRFDGSVAQLD